MTNNTITLIRSLIEREISQANDDYSRCRNNFRGCTEEEMQSQYGSSGRTRAELLESYRNKLSNAQRALMDFNISIGG